MAKKIPTFTSDTVSSARSDISRIVEAKSLNQRASIMRLRLRGHCSSGAVSNKRLPDIPLPISKDCSPPSALIYTSTMAPA